MALRIFDTTRSTAHQFQRVYAAADSLRPPLDAADRQVATYVLIELVTSWQNFLRQYCLASTAGGWLSDGSRVTGPTTARSIGDALDLVVPLFKPSATKSATGWTHRDEPNWLDPRTTSSALMLLDLSNAAGFASALSAGSGIHDRVATCRNFVAHRNRGTAIKVRRLAREFGIVDEADPEELPFLRSPGRPQNLVSDWLEELIAIVELVPQ